MLTYDLLNEINQRLGSLRSGTLSFWGHWFGKPYDNIHRIVGADARDETVVVFFDHGESLIVEALRDWSLEDGKLLIQEAGRVRWQWFYYGRLPSQENLRFQEYRLTEGGVDYSSDFQPQQYPRLDRNAPAVQLHAQN